MLGFYIYFNRFKVFRFKILRLRASPSAQDDTAVGAAIDQQTPVYRAVADEEYLISSHKAPIWNILYLVSCILYLVSDISGSPPLSGFGLSAVDFCPF